MSRDTPGVIAPPPLIFLAPLLIGVGLDRWLGVLPLGLALPARAVVAVPLLALGATFIIAALGRFRRAGTAPEPWKPVSALVVEGIYKISRNPMYVGMALVYLALAVVAAGSGIALLLLPVALAAVRYGVIAREERYMAGRFGADYDAYRVQVRRWL